MISPSVHCCRAAPAPPTAALVQHAEALRKERRSSTLDLLFPMYVVPLNTALEMSEVRSHEELLAENSLIQFDESKGRAIFVSHEWSGTQHADPEGEQLAVLQNALRHMLRARDRVPIDVTTEILFGQQQGLKTSEMHDQPLFIWFDYWCVPQLQLSVAGLQVETSQQKALDSIPAYVEKSCYFFILCPHVRHQNSGQLLSKRTWATRAWCRLERLASQLSVAENRQLIEIQSAKCQTLTLPYEYIREPVGEGEFTVESDRAKAAAIVRRIFQNKLVYYLRRGNLHNYRVFLNLQRVHFRNLPVEPMDDIIPGFKSDSMDPAIFFCESFMYQNGFQNVSDRDEAGWTPICYAALGGNAMLISSLLEKKADPRDSITRSDPKLFMTSGATLLTMCVFLRHHEALRLLLEREADANATDGFTSTPMHYACVNHNVEAIQILRDAGANVDVVNKLHHSPRMLAGGAGTGSGSEDVIDFLLSDAPQSEINFALHYCILFAGVSKDVVSALIRKGADINQQLVLPRFSPLGMAFTYFSWRHRWSPTAVSYYALHHSKASPLMCCIICGCFDAAATLIAAGARLDLKNIRGKTAADLARENGAPDFLLEALQAGSQQRLDRVEGTLSVQV
ncbi:unnamed protein product [Symbiodinium microadriaticum]|nr:unnamed protein product [Symbiodinium sp. KB8]CAE7747570.1 unnamed protein product [Symbiodinium microadriaticum]